MTGLLRNMLAHPLTRGLDIDSPSTTILRRRIVRDKAFLRQLYEEWYRRIGANLPTGNGEILELGSGAGFMNEYIDGLITSEIFATPGASVILDATKLPFAKSSLRAIVMTDVFHHIAAPRAFFAEAVRCLKPGGAVVMIEPWVSPWSRFVYRRFHHEPFEPEAERWEFPATGPLSGANGALPWIVFDRDRAAFEREFPQLRIRGIQPMMPIAYLLSGGVAMRSLMPGFTYRFWRKLENAVGTITETMAMFAMIVIDVRKPT
jgi:SAM-dependent methyltransferase